jgi:hypothetical protein
VHRLRRQRAGEEEVTAEAQDQDPDAVAAADRIVPMISVTACRKCRRARGAALAGIRGTRASSKDGSGRCPHGLVDRTVWAPGEGPEAARSAETAETLEAPEDPSSQEERRQGPI